VETCCLPHLRGCRLIEREKVPLFGGATALHVSYDDGNCSARLACRQQLNLPGSMLKFDWKSAFWVNSAVAKQVYAGKDSAQGMVASTKQDFESWVAPLVNQTVADAQACYDGTQSSLQGHGGRGGADCSKVLDALAVAAGGGATKRWIALWAKLMVLTLNTFAQTSTLFAALLFALHPFALCVCVCEKGDVRGRHGGLGGCEQRAVRVRQDRRGSGSPHNTRPRNYKPARGRCGQLRCTAQTNVCPMPPPLSPAWGSLF